MIFQTVCGPGGCKFLKLVVFYITVARGIIGNVLSKLVNVSILLSILDIITDYIVFSLVILQLLVHACA